MNDFPGTNGSNNLKAVLKETYAGPGKKGLGKPRGPYNKIKAMIQHLKEK